VAVSSQVGEPDLMCGEVSATVTPLP